MAYKSHHDVATSEVEVTLALLKRCQSSEIIEQRTGLHKGVFVVPEYFNNTLGTNSHI